jgi:hypothetical protein
LIRNTFRLASKKDWDALRRDVKPMYTAVNSAAARLAFEELTERWGKKYGGIVRLRENAWEEFIQTRWAVCWKRALNAFAITVSDRFPAAESYLKKTPVHR